MLHTVTSKLNKSARQHTNEKGVTFFVSLARKTIIFRLKKMSGPITIPPYSLKTLRFNSITIT